MAGTERQWDHSRQRPSSPYSGNIRSPSPNNNSHLPSGLSTRSHSPGRGSRAHMDQVASSKDHSKRRSRDLAPDSGGRWEKTPHEDRPYPMLHPPALAASSPKDDVIYFKRREGRANEPSSRDRDASGTMYHERLNTNDSRHRGTERVDGPGDRWGKNTAVEPDRPYPERPRPSPDSGNNHGKHSRTRSRDQINILPVTPSPTLEKVSPRGNRGRGKDQHKRKSNEPPPFSSTNEDGPQDTDKGSAVPWWEQSTYGPKSKKEEPAVELSKDSREEKIAVATKRASSSTGATKARSGAKETSSSSQDAKEEVPWWEQSTYKLKPKVAEAVDQVTSQLAGVDMKSSSSTQGHGNSDSLADADIVAKRKALGQKAPTSGVEAMTLVSRGGDDSG
ncbi:hypothetical protein BGZ54_003105 [Gamsiella multidivaricata]|nr:hypothetical protein BGZ54_003105 [Gamsiella multidivaricata]